MLILGRYEMGPCVGRGGMGAVYRALDTLTGVQVAIKQLRLPQGEPDPSQIERLRREAEALKRLDHPNIVRVHDVAYDAGKNLIVMEYVGGGSLADLLASTPETAPLPVDRILNLGLDVCDALTRSHRLGIIHRDIKPSNVLLADDGTPRLADFGAAYFLDRSRVTDDLTLIGTVEYLSPEVLAGDEPDPRTDIWALGVMLFELLALEHPFARANLGQTLAAITSAEPPNLEHRRPDCPAALVDVVYRMLAKCRDERIASTRQVGAELDQILHGRSRSVRPARASPLRRQVPNNLPVMTATLVGRQPEIEQLLRVLDDENVRLITIVAPGGMGKTRLAIDLAQRLACLALQQPTSSQAARALDGAFLVQLAPLVSHDFIAAAIAEALSIKSNASYDAQEQLQRQLKPKRMLLILDNFEHLLNGAPLVNALLQAAPSLTIIATSRERLGLTGEWLFPLTNLPLPDPQSHESVQESSAVNLFVQVARSIAPDFELTPENTEGVVRVCCLVEGVPLGILLSASWVGTLSPREIADEISTSLDFLRAELRDLPERQRSMRAAFEHSFALLNEPERAALAALSVFRGGFLREAARSVVGASVHTLTALCNKCLLRRTPNGGRYEMHELLRQFAESKLQRDPAIHRSVSLRFGSHFAKLVADRMLPMRSPNPRQALSEIEAELDNVRAAWSYLLGERRLEEIATMLDGLDLFLTRRAALDEGTAAFASLVECLRATAGAATAEPTSISGLSTGELTRLLGRALSLHALYLRQKGNYVEARTRLHEALALLEAPQYLREKAHALVALGSTEAKIGVLTNAIDLVEQGTACYRTCRDSWGLATALETLGWLHSVEGDLAKAESVYEESARLQQASGHLQSSLMGLGMVTAEQGRYEDGCQMLQRALQLFETAGDSWNRLRCQNGLANAQRKRGNYEVAEAMARSCRSFSRQIGNWDHEAWSNFQLGNILKEQGRLEEAEAEIEAAHATSLQAQDVGKLALAELEFGDLAFLKGEYAEAERHLASSLEHFEASGHTWGTVLALDYLGYVACHQQDFRRAADSFERALRIALNASMLPFATNISAGIALLLARTGLRTEAVELLALAQTHSATERHTVSRRVVPLLRELRECLPPVMFDAAYERGKSRSLGMIELSGVA